MTHSPDEIIRYIMPYIYIYLFIGGDVCQSLFVANWQRMRILNNRDNLYVLTRYV